METSTAHIIDLEVVFYFGQSPLKWAKLGDSNLNGQISKYLDPTERYECFESVHGIFVPYLTHVLCRNVYIFPLDLVIY